MDRSHDLQAHFPQILIAFLLSVSGVFAASVYLTDTATTITAGTCLYTDGYGMVALNTSCTNALYYSVSNPSGYVNAGGVVSAVGNWSADKPNYSTTSQANGLYYPLVNNPNGYYNSTTLPTGLTINDVVSGVGNWSADKPNYNTTVQLNSLYDSIGSAAARAFPGTCAAGYVVMNTTTSGVQCVNVNSLIAGEFVLVSGDTMTGNLTMSGASVNGVNMVNFNQGFAEPPDGLYAGGLYWSSNYQTLDLRLNQNVDLQIGQEHLLLVHNDENFTIPNGVLVYLSGSVLNGKPGVKVADNSVERTALVTGMTTESIAPGAEGFVTQLGIVYGVDTSGFTDGETIYLGTTGQFTATPPLTNSVKVGQIIDGGSVTGAVLVKVLYEFDPIYNAEQANLARTGACAPGSFVNGVQNNGPSCAIPVNTMYDAGSGLILTNVTFSLNESYTDSKYIKVNSIANVSAINLNQSYVPLTTTIGQIYWDNDSKTVAVTLSNDVTLQVGQEEHIRAVNKETDSILNGEVVYISGAQGMRPAIKRASSLTEDESYFIGIATETIATNQEGYVTTYGLVHDVDTSMWAAGDTLYLNSTSGTMVNYRVASPQHSSMVGIVTQSHAIHGTIFVNPSRGFETNELHDVSGTVPNQNGFVLVWNQAAGYYEPVQVIGQIVSVNQTAESKAVTGSCPTGYAINGTSNNSAPSCMLVPATSPLWTETYVPVKLNGTMVDSPIQVIEISNTSDEEYLSVWNKSVYWDNTNKVGGVNVPAAYTHQAVWTVNGAELTGSGSISTVAYDPVLNYTTWNIAGATSAMETLVAGGTIYYGGNNYYVLDRPSPNVLYVGGYQNVTLVSWTYRAGAYVDVNSVEGQDAGYSWSRDGVWKWAAYMPPGSNGTKICFTNGVFTDVMCLNENGNVHINGQLSATTVNTKNYAGTNTYTNIINNGDGSITLPTETVTLYKESNGNSALQTYTVQGGTTGVDFAALTNNEVNFIWIDYNSGNPQYVVNADEFYGNYITIVPYAKVTREGSIIVIMANAYQGNAVPEKLTKRAVASGILRESGLTLSETGNNEFAMTEGVVWVGIQRIVLEAMNSNQSNMSGGGPVIVDQYNHVGGNWTETRVKKYNNTHYDDGNNTVELGAGNYTINWIYRTEENYEAADIEYAHIVLGDAQYSTLESARLAQPRADIPHELQYNSFLVGRIIVQKGASTGDVANAWTQTFTSSTPTKHNDLTGLQGGTINEFYHLSLADYNVVVGKVWNAINTTANIQSLGFSTTSQANGLYYPLTTNPSGFYNVTTLPAGLTLSEVVAGVGNWSADKVNYYNKSEDWANDTASFDPLGAAALRAAPGNCPSGQIVMNTTTTGVQCVATSSLATPGDGTGGWINTSTTTTFQGLSVRNLTGSSDIYFPLKNLTFTDGSNVLMTLTQDDNVEVVNNVTALNFQGNLDASYVQNAAWNSTQIASGAINTTKLSATNSPTVGAHVSVGTGGQFTFDSVAAEITIIKFLLTPVSTTSNTVWSQANSLTMALSNASTYLVKCEVIKYSGAANTGVQFRTNTTGTPTTVIAAYTGMASASAMEAFSGTNTASNSFLATGSNTQAGIAWINEYIVTAANPVNWTIEIKSEVAGTAATLDSGSYCEAIKVG